MKIYPIVDLDSDWYPKNALGLFQQNSSIQFVERPQKANLVWIFSYYVASQVVSLPPGILRLLPSLVRRHPIFSGRPIITTVHHLTPEKKSLWQPTIGWLDKITTYWQTFSDINVPFFRQFINQPIKVLPYWIDTQQFHPLPKTKRQQIRDKLGLPQNKTILGSFQRDTEGDLITPKLEKGPDVFADIVTKLDRSKIFVLLAGPRRQYLEKRLSQASIPFRSLGKTPFSVMNDLYNALDYYLVTSRIEGGPQAILEAMAARTKIFSTRVGVASLLSPTAVFSTAAQCAAKLKEPYPEVLDRHLASAKKLTCQQVIPRFEHFFATVIDKHEATHSI